MIRDNSIINAYELRNSKTWPECVLGEAASYTVGGYLAPLRPQGIDSMWRRFHATWLVFTGQADALVWPYQGWTPPEDEMKF